MGYARYAFNAGSAQPSGDSLPGLMFPFLLLLVLLFPATTCTATSEVLVPLHVEKGTNLIHLARDFCHRRTDWKTIARINGLLPPYLIREQSSLDVPLSLLRHEPLQATLAALDGGVGVQQDTTSQPVTRGMVLVAGQTLTTGPHGFAHVVFPDQRYLHVEPDSTLRLNYLIRLADSSIKIDFTLSRGRILNRIKKRLHPNDSHRARTPIAITGIRGTSYRIKNKTGQDSSVETLAGKVAVAAAGGAVTLQRNQGTRIQPGRQPIPPRALPAAPVQLQHPPVFRGLPAVIPAPEHAQAASFKMRITRDIAGTESIKELFCQPGSDFILDSVKDGAYFYFLTATDQEGFESIPAGPFPLRVRTVPVAPLIASPEPGQFFWEKQVTIRWLQGEQVEQYHYQLATDPTFSDIIDEQQTPNPALQTMPLPAGKYFFRVQAIAPDGFTSFFSPTIAWKRVDQPAMEDMTIAPATTPTLQWSAVAEANAYDLQIAEDGSFGKLVLEKRGLTTTSHTLEAPLLPGTYFVRMRATIGSAPPGPWTSPQRLTMEQPPPGWKEILIGVVMVGILFL